MKRSFEVFAVVASVLLAACALGQDDSFQILRVPPISFEMSPSYVAQGLPAPSESRLDEDASSRAEAVGNPAITSDWTADTVSAKSQSSPSNVHPPESSRLPSDEVSFRDDALLESPLDPANFYFDRGEEPELIPPPAPIADDNSDATESSVSLDTENYQFDDSGTLILKQQPPAPERPISSRKAVRFGYWDVDFQGDPTKVGEYQSLQSSVFWDLDGLHTDGLRTLNYHATGFDQDGSEANLEYFGPQLAASVYFQRFLRRLDNDPLTGFTPFDQQPSDPLPPAPRNFRVMKEDLNVGEDYAIRVQELDASFEGQLTDKLKWKLNVWGLRKRGERQAAAMAHCYTPPNATDSNGNPVTGIACHILSQRQRIDWLTTEIQPVLQSKFGRANVEYSHTTRTFSQDDQVTTRPYDNFGFTGDLPYAVVPENQTHIDRLRIGVDLPDRRNVYAQLFNGNTNNRFRDTDRRFRGFDVRLTDRSINGLSITTYAKNYVQKGERPGVLLPLETNATIRSPIDYDQTTAGIKGRWRPFYGEHSFRSRLLLSGGYEFRQLERGNATFTEQVLSVDQSQTTSNSVYTRASMRWSPHLDSYTRYRVAFVNDPLFGVPVGNTATNSSLPTQQHLVEIGSTWTPIDTFLISASFGFNSSWHSSEIADFQEDDYPITFTAWYAPSPRWSISGGLAFYSNWITQDITLGSKSNPVTLPWDYSGRSDVVNVGTTYAWTKWATLSAGLDFVRGSNRAEPPWGYADLTPLSDVSAEIIRFSCGIDYCFRPGIGGYLRYQVFDYEDKSEDFNSGTTNLLLGGFNVIY